MLFHALYILAIVVEAMTAALAAGRRAMDWVGVCMLGCVTALGGGSTRDLLLGHYPLSWVQHPYLLFRSELYASVSVVAGTLYVGGLRAGLPHDPVMIVAMAAGLALRLLAIRYGWNMPRFVYTRDLH